jgi:predicted nucleic acid-binding protein
VFVLDTNVVSELRHGKPGASAAVRAWAAQMPASQLYLSAISILELEKGVQALERRTPPQGGALRAWLQGVRIAFAGRVLPFTERTATLCAATALEHGMAIVTRNVADFEGCGIVIHDPWNRVD